MLLNSEWLFFPSPKTLKLWRQSIFSTLNKQIFSKTQLKAKSVCFFQAILCLHLTWIVFFSRLTDKITQIISLLFQLINIQIPGWIEFLTLFQPPIPNLLTDSKLLYKTKIDWDILEIITLEWSNFVRKVKLLSVYIAIVP